MKIWPIILTPYELEMASEVGRARYRERVAHGADPGPGASREAALREGNNVRGTCCEYAASIAFNCFWRPAVGYRPKRDVGDLFEARSKNEPLKTLFVRVKDVTELPDTPFVLVDCQQFDQRKFLLLGWVFAGDAPLLVERKDGDHDSAHCVGEKWLRSNEELWDWITLMRGHLQTGVRYG